MKSNICLICVVLLGISFGSQGLKIRYDNYKVYRFTPKTEEDFQLLSNLRSHDVDVIYWQKANHKGKPFDIMFPPHSQGDTFEFLIKKEGLQPILMIENVQDEIDAEASKILPNGDEFNWETYGTLEDIYHFLHKIAEPHDFVKVKDLSFDGGYALKVLAIEKPVKKPQTDKLAIWIDGGMYGREWLSPAVVTFVINQLLTSKTRAAADIINDFDLFILPVMNPKGYSYSHETDRMWKKTRDPISSTVGCRGADIDRNWNYKFNERINREPCSEFYNGGSPGSLYEVGALSKFFNGTPKRFEMFLTLHGYNEMVLFPYGFKNETHPLYEKLKEWGHNAANSMNTHGTGFKSGNIAAMLSERPGCSVDWVFEEQNVDIVLAIELGSASKGFINLQDQIIPTGQEFMKGLIFLAEVLRNLMKDDDTESLGNSTRYSDEL